MKIKTYLVSTLSEAVEQIKREMGPEAVILSTRKQAASDRWWSRGNPKLEVTAAIDHVDPSDVPSEPLAKGPAQTLQILSQMAEDKMKPVREEMKKMRELLNQLTPAAAQAQPAAVPAQPAPAEVSVENTFNLGDFVEQSKKAEKPQSILGAGEPADPILEVCRELLWHRVRPRAVQDLADHVMKKENLKTVEDVREAAAEWILGQLPNPVSYPALPDGEQKIIAVFGPTGSGKTTTLVKLASHLSHAPDGGKRSIAFITLDHFRIGAEEQLKKFAAIMNAPCELAVTDQQFQAALNRFIEFELVFVDTTGRSPKDQEGIYQLERSFQLSQVGKPVWKALALPASLQDPDLTNMMNQFSPLQCQSLIMTKLDESVSFGSLFNATYVSRLPLSYFTTGQMVPEDFEAASKERVLDCLLNFSGHFTVPDQVPSKDDYFALHLPQAKGERQ